MEIDEEKRKEINMRLQRKFVILFVVFIGLPLAIFSIVMKNNEAKNFYADGFVVNVEWETRNHGAPLIEIQQINGEIKSINSTAVVLSEWQIKVGDSFRKDAGSLHCEINGRQIVFSR